MDEVVCPKCGKEINLVRFGYSWIGLCCDRIVYDRPDLPQNTSEEIKDKTRTGSD